MKPTRALKTILLSVGGGAIVGSLVGYLLGKVSPGLIVGLLGEAAFLTDPGRTGLGLGIVNGIIFGFILGAILVFVEVLGNKNK